MKMRLRAHREMSRISSGFSFAIVQQYVRNVGNVGNVER